MAWLMENHTNLFSALFAVHAAAVVIVNMTTTPKDDEIVGKSIQSLRNGCRHFTKIAKIGTLIGDKPIMTVHSWRSVVAIAAKHGAKYPELVAAQWALESQSLEPSGTHNYLA